MDTNTKQEPISVEEAFTLPRKPWPGNWRVAIQIITPEGTVMADNVYSYKDQEDATEAAFSACELAEQDAVEPDDTPRGEP